MSRLRVITIDRSSVDPYGSRVGGRLKDMGSFETCIGGSPTTIACGRAQPGLRSAVITGAGDAPEERLAARFAPAARFSLVKGFAVGRMNLGQVARNWFAGRIGDVAVVERVTEHYARLCALWARARQDLRGVTA